MTFRAVDKKIKVCPAGCRHFTGPPGGSQTTLTSLSLDRFFCPICDQDWLIKTLNKKSRRYKV